MARSKIYEALLGESKKVTKKGGFILREAGSPKKTKEKKQEDLDRVGTGSGQGKVRDRIRSGQGQYSDTTITPLYHHRDDTVTPPIVKKGQGRDNNKNHTDGDRVGTGSPKEIVLPKQQLKIYDWFLKRGFKSTFNKPLIQSETGIAYTTIRKTLRKFTTIGILNVSYEESLKHFEYELNPHIKIKRVTVGSGSGQGQDRVREPSLISSSSLLSKKTTTLRDIEIILSSDPELGYWHQLKLKPQQIKKWMDEIQINLEDVIDSLKHCRYDLIDNGLLKSKPVRDPFSWLYKRLKQYGYYHAPKDYKSFEDKAIERAKQRLKKKQERAKELEAIREAELEAERKIAFEKMMADPDGEAYNRCFKKLNKIEKRLKGQGFVACMRKSFNDLVEEGKVEIA